MYFETTIEIDAAPSQVWETYLEVERWPEWTASVERILPLGDGALEVGSRFEIKQPRLPKLVWVVTEVDSGRPWTWEQHSFGEHTVATHEVGSNEVGGALVRLRIDQRGSIGAAVGAVMKRLTRRYLDLEANGLKAPCESASSRSRVLRPRLQVEMRPVPTVRRPLSTRSSRESPCPGSTVRHPRRPRSSQSRTGTRVLCFGSGR